MEHNSDGCISNLYGGFRHEYSEKNCKNCGTTYCYSCCGSTNVDQGGKYDPDSMICPVCGHDYYKK